MDIHFDKPEEFIVRSVILEDGEDVFITLRNERKEEYKIEDRIYIKRKGEEVRITVYSKKVKIFYEFDDDE